MGGIQSPQTNAPVYKYIKIPMETYQKKLMLRPARQQMDPEKVF